MLVSNAKRRNYSLNEIFFIILLLIIFNAPQIIVFGVLSIYFLLQLLIQKKLIISMPGWKIYVYFIISGIFIGLINCARLENQGYGLVRHLYYILLIGLSWFFGYDYISTRQYERKKVLSCFLIISSIKAVIVTISNVITISHMGLSSFASDSATSLRGDILGGNTLCVLGLYILIFYPKTDKADYINNNWFLLVIIHIFAIFSNFSRTVILDAIILVLFSGFRANWKIIRRIVLCSVILIIILNILVPSLTTSMFDRILRSSTEVNFITNNWSERNIVWNWRGYEAHCELERFLNSNLFIQLFGSGFGTSLNVGNYAYLVTGEGTLPFLHNGYFTQLMIFGLSGVVLLIFLFISIYRSGSCFAYDKNKYFVHGVVVMTALNTYFDHGILFSCELATIFCLVGAIFALNGIDKLSIDCQE